MNVDWRIILQWSAAASPLRECLRFTNVSAVEPIQIAIYGEVGCEAKAKMLFQSLETTIMQFSGGVQHQAQCGGPGLLGCMGRSEPTCHSILVVILSNHPVSSHTEQLMLDWLTSGPAHRVVLPVIPAAGDPTVLLPPSLSHLVVLRDTNGTISLGPDVLRAAGVGSEQFRLFISYRRADAQDVADQLFDRFSHEGFDVFLDRFRGTPGRAFPPQLSESMIDKGMVVVVESPNVWMSQWTVAEVAFANQYRLGLMSLKMPGGHRFVTIPDPDRFSTTPVDWNLPPAALETLAPTTLERFVHFVRDRYALQMLRRRVYLESLLNTALIPHGINARREIDGVHVITQSPGYSIELTSRKPQLENVRKAADAASANSGCGVVVGPRGFQSPRVKSDSDWLFARTRVASVEETAMTQFATRIANGVPLP
jgi:hypothetical protein